MSEMSAAEAATVARFDAAEPAPESWREDGLREALVRGLGEWAAREGFPGLHWEPYADAVLALPEVAALRAKATAADRVRDALNSHRGCDVETIARALDGDDPC